MNILDRPYLKPADVVEGEVELPIEYLNDGWNTPKIVADSVLEIGGYALLRSDHQIKALTILDPAPLACDWIQRGRSCSVTRIRSKLDKLPEARYDVIYSSWSLDCVDDGADSRLGFATTAEQRAEIVRALRPGGLLIILLDDAYRAQRKVRPLYKALAGLAPVHSDYSFILIFQKI